MGIFDVGIWTYCGHTPVLSLVLSPYSNAEMSSTAFGICFSSSIPLSCDRCSWVVLSVKVAKSAREYSCLGTVASFCGEPEGGPLGLELGTFLVIVGKHSKRFPTLVPLALGSPFPGSDQGLLLVRTSTSTYSQVRTRTREYTRGYKYTRSRQRTSTYSYSPTRSSKSTSTSTYSYSRMYSSTYSYSRVFLQVHECRLVNFMGRTCLMMRV